jgi:hypothetical protein
MVDLYKVLGVKPNASAAEIKSAYRRLARRHHPDVSQAPETAREFSLITLAYRTLSDPQERAHFDEKMRRHLNGIADSVLHSDNVHARRLRVISMQARLDRAVDRWLEEERRENFAMQQAVFTTVALFMSTFFAAMLKPTLWTSFGWVGRGVIFTLSLMGVWHLAGRIREAFARYTYREGEIHESIINEDKEPRKPFSRATAWGFLLAGAFISVAAGLFLGDQIQQNYNILGYTPGLFDQQLRPNLLLYPPIAVLVVDTMHMAVAKIDGSMLGG